MIEVRELKDKWLRYDARLHEGDGGGSLAGAAFIIAKSGVTDVGLLLDEVERLQLIERKAQGLVRTAHPQDVGEHEIVRQWWDGLVEALEET